MKAKYKIALTIIAICLSITFMFGTSYAMWNISRVSNAENNLVSGCFSMEYQYDNVINLTNDYPMTDADGLKKTPYKMTVKNTCNIAAKLNIVMNVLNDSTLDASKMKISVSNGKELSPIIVGSLSETTPVGRNASTAKKAYDLGVDYLEPDETKVYEFRLWIDEKTGNEVMNQTFKTDIVIQSVATKPAENAVAKLTELAKTNTIEMFTDDTADNNIRYMGKDPANYVDIGEGYYTEDLYYGYYDANHYEYREYTSLEACQTGVEGTTKYNVDCEKIHSKGEPILWRVIGVMNNVDDGTGTKETRLKIIRDGQLGDETFSKISWDIKCESGYDDITGECSGNHTYRNNWAASSLNKTLNEAYYNSTKTTEPNYVWSGLTTTGTIRYQYLDFTNNGFKSKSQSLVGDTVYHLGGPTADNYEIATTKAYYDIERSEIVHTGNPTTWTGKVGLMYASDYGYATSGGSTKDKAACAAKELYNWNSAEYVDCKNNNWLFDKTGDQWLLSPFARDEFQSTSIEAGTVNGNDVDAYDYGHVRPVLYLKSEVRILGGDGTKSNPYKLGL